MLGDSTAAAVFAEIAQESYWTGGSVQNMLRELHARYGVFHSIGGYVIAESLEAMDRVLCDIRGAAEPAYPEPVAGQPLPGSPLRTSANPVFPGRLCKTRIPACTKNPQHINKLDALTNHIPHQESAAWNLPKKHTLQRGVVAY